TGREDDYTWTEPYMDNSQVFVVKKDSGITKVADLKDKVVTAQADSAALNALNDEEHADTKALFSKLLTCQQYNSAFMDLEAGAVDSVAMDIGVAKYQIQGKEDQYVILDEPILEEQYGVGFFKGNTELRDKVQNTLKEMVKDGFFAELSDKYFGYDVCILKAD
ncbi:MAG: transporter substrate-binding domain-containing protein, partial [Monoglobus pectinilyticus]